MPVTTVKDEVFYTPTYLCENPLDAPISGKVSLFLRRLELRERQKSGPLIKSYLDVVYYPDEEAMGHAIELHGWQEMPAEAEGDLTFVPEGWAPKGVPVERGFNWRAPRNWYDRSADLPPREN